MKAGGHLAIGEPGDFDLNPFCEAFSFVLETSAIAAATFIADFHVQFGLEVVELEMGWTASVALKLCR